MRFVINLTDRDLGYFRQALKTSRVAVKHADESEIVEAIGDVLADIKSKQPLPDFVEKRLPELESLLRMLQDDEWELPNDERERLLATFVYFGDPEDILPDSIPVIGYLDDVIMIELVVRELHHVREAYDDFCKFRDEHDQRIKSDADVAIHRERIERRRKQLHQRMRRRRAEDKRTKKSTALW